MSLAARVHARETVFGLIVKMPAPAIAEMGAHAGFDFILVDAEHGPGDGESLEHHLRAADGAGVPSIVRVGGTEPIDTLRALDAGATGVVVPHVDDADAAEAAVRAAHYPPIGRRGLAVSTRAGRQGLTSLAEHVADAERNTLVIVQVEDRRAVEELDAIVRVPRLDAIFLGPSDLSMSLGRPGELDHPEVAAAIEHVAATVIGSAGPALCVLATDEADARAWQARGASIILFSAAALFSRRLRQIAADARTAPPALAGAHTRPQEAPHGDARR